jgi:glycosyltransferase involved in cell wall biosynthesis
VKKKLLFIHPGELDEPRGGNNVAVWMLEALKESYEITVLTWQPFDFEKINFYFATSLCNGDFRTIIPPALLRNLIDIIPYDPWNFQRFVLLMRFCKTLKNHYDILLSACNETDFGAVGIQYIHYPYLEKIWEKGPKKFDSQGLPSYLLKLFKNRIRPWRIISGFSFERMKKNISLVNSDWTASVFRRVYDSECLTVYPPVPGHFPEIPWDRRETGFVCIGRFSGEKRLEEVINIIGVLRKDFPEVHLHLIGSPDKHDERYYHRVKRKVECNTDWVSLTENPSRTELIQIIGRHKYGIHAMVNEHFGISVAEMVRGGCIVFLPDGGGQIEIVGNDERLLFHTRENALEKIRFVLNHPQEQNSIRQHLDQRKAMFSAERFMDQMQQIVRDFAVKKT